MNITASNLITGLTLQKLKGKQDNYFFLKGNINIQHSISFYSCSRMEKNKAYLLDILVMKGLALCEGYNRTYLELDADSVLSMKEEILDVCNEITKFAEVSDTKVTKLIFHERKKTELFLFSCR